MAVTITAACPRIDCGGGSPLLAGSGGLELGGQPSLEHGVEGSRRTHPGLSVRRDGQREVAQGDDAPGHLPHGPRALPALLKDSPVNGTSAPVFGLMSDS